LAQAAFIDDDRQLAEGRKDTPAQGVLKRLEIQIPIEELQ